MVPTLADRIDAELPQTQCTRCGYESCRPYAEAIAGGEADINRCPPGGPVLIARIAAITGRIVRPLEPECGTHGPRLLATIDESRCIGCTLCIAACPVDAIIGAAKRMHAVLPSLCSGCELCVAPCPVDCIAIVADPRPWTPADAAAARLRHGARQARLARGRGNQSRTATLSPEPDQARAQRVQRVEAALARARSRRRPRLPAA